MKKIFQVVKEDEFGNVEAISERFDTFHDALSAKTSPEQFVAEYEDLGTGEVAWVADFDNQNK